MYAPAPPNVPSMAGSEWTHTAHRPYHSNVGFGFFGRYFSNLCIALSSCFYFLCCCWALEDCIGRPRWEIGHSDPRPGPISGPFGPNPPDIPVTLPGPPGQPARAEALIG
ncbi:uncharacterized protein LOC132626852 [Lycium barbarum]|uniref:uncharacterized protein LOC132626852 n=1 Tax=Lycium barbarum TaxID=112863 RepID=UPI00293ED349|nr:uncharacterized protein LOC132626852 [Lycium barbarum]